MASLSEEHISLSSGQRDEDITVDKDNDGEDNNDDCRRNGDDSKQDHAIIMMTMMCCDVMVNNGIILLSVINLRSCLISDNKFSAALIVARKRATTMMLSVPSPLPNSSSASSAPLSDCKSSRFHHDLLAPRHTSIYFSCLCTSWSYSIT